MPEFLRPLVERLGLPLAPAMQLFLQAVTHSSHTAQHGEAHYERLEFLGDAVLKFAIADVLYERFPDDPEGTMTKILTKVVSDQTLARIARDLELGNYLRLGTGEEHTGGRERSGTLASAMEALLAASYLTFGIGTTRDLVARLWAAEIDRAHGEPGADNFKALLQERTQQSLGQLPRYRILADTKRTPYEHLFVVEVEVDGQVVAQGEGSTKRAAEQEAARQALGILGWK
ncbi:MAG: ribonuclease III [Candidatus Sericytochromatia bacterium]|nr:ribonuclease III [Candidatus Tanganyikabacteria bacterium]